MVLALPAQLAGALTDREAIADALYRAVLSFDCADETLLLSAVTDDISIEMAGTAANGVPELKAAVWDRVSKLDTTHFLSNLRISVESGTKARLTCSAMAQHVRPGKGREPGPHRFMSGGMYLCEVVKVEDLWKVKSWKADFFWVDGEPSVMEG